MTDDIEPRLYGLGTTKGGVDVKIHPEWDKFTEGLEKFRIKFRYIFFGIKVLGNLGIIYFLLKHDWFNAFLMFVVFFPEEVTIIRFFKKIPLIYKSWIYDKKGTI